MVRPKSKDSEKIGFHLDKNIIERIRYLANFEKMGQSEFIELVITRWDEGINPESKLNSLFKERDDIDYQMKENQVKIKDMTSQIVLHNKMKQQKNQRKPEALKLIGNLLLRNDFDEAERISRVWQRETGIPAFQLLVEAKEKTEGL